MSTRLFAVMFFFSAVVLEPINQHFVSDDKGGKRPPSSYFSHLFDLPSPAPDVYSGQYTFANDTDDPDWGDSWNREKGYLWAYLVFVYFFTSLTVWIMNSETFRVIKIRQDYLGTQSTITDRTFRLSGVPRSSGRKQRLRSSSSGWRLDWWKV